jgi:hypothetical protein
MQFASRWVISGALLWAANVHADEVHLVGGTTLDGKATRHGDKVVVEMESGEITLSADSVERIDRKQSAVQRYDTLASKLEPGDIKGRLSLAEFCREHAMTSREKELLQQVLEIDSNQAEARARLGYVKTPSGWISHDENMRSQGFVQRDGQWVTRERALELDRLQAEADAAARDRDAAQAALDNQRAESAARKLEMEMEDERALQPTAAPYGYGYGGYGYGYGYGVIAPTTRHIGGGSNVGHPFPINGVRDPRSTGWKLNGVRNPRSF